MSKTFDVVSSDAEGASDRDLVAAFQKGDLSAFAEIYVRYRRNAQRVCRRFLRNPQDIEEAVQETMLRAFKSLPEFNGEYALRSWVERIATNFCLDTLRARARRRGVVEEIELSEEDADTYSGTAPAPDPSEIVEALFVVDEVRGILEGIPQRHRTALVMREIEGRSHAEIGDALGISDSQAKSLIHRAKRTFRRAWKEGSSRIRGILPPFLLHARMPGLERLYHPPTPLSTETATLLTSPAVNTAVVSTGERVATAVTAIATVAVVSLGTVVAPRPNSEPPRPGTIENRPVASAPTTTPAPSPSAEKEAEDKADVKAPEASVQSTGTKAEKSESIKSDSNLPAADSLAADEDAEGAGTESAQSEEPPEESYAGYSSPKWSLGFATSLSSTYDCGCSSESGLLSSASSGSAETQISFSQEAYGHAADGEGDAAWRLWIEYSGSAEWLRNGELNSRFYLDSGGHWYKASSTLVESKRAADDSFAFIFEGRYERVEDATGDGFPRSGIFRAMIHYWRDAQTLYRSEFQLVEDEPDSSQL